MGCPPILYLHRDRSTLRLEIPHCADTGLHQASAPFLASHKPSRVPPHPQNPTTTHRGRDPCRAPPGPAPWPTSASCQSDPFGRGRRGAHGWNLFTTVHSFGPCQCHARTTSPNRQPPWHHAPHPITIHNQCAYLYLGLADLGCSCRVTLAVSSGSEAICSGREPGFRGSRRAPRWRAATAVRARLKSLMTTQYLPRPCWPRWRWPQRSGRGGAGWS